MDIARDRGRRPSRLRFFMSVVAIAALVVGCGSGAGSASPPARATSPTVSDAAVTSALPVDPIPLPTPTERPVAAPTPTPNATPAPTPTPTTTPTPVATPLPHVGLSPSGPWAGIRWISAGAVFPQVPAPTPDGYSAPRIFGWSGGYVGFIGVSALSATGHSSVLSTSSTDGLHWTSVRPVSMSHLEGDMAISEMFEGPSGLLAIGHYGRGACGGPATVDAMWTSTDGSTWLRVTPPKDFRTASVYTVDGGSKGFVASGTLKDGRTQRVWVAKTGRDWHRVDLPTSTAGKVVLDGATSFAGGFVVAGGVLGDGGCGGDAVVTPSLWWSANGASWTRSVLTGAKPAHDATMTVTRISDHAVMAVATTWNATTQDTIEIVWVTADGHSWRLVTSPSKLLGSMILTDRERGLLFLEPPELPGPFTIATVGDDLSVTILAQTGDGPTESENVWIRQEAFGPTGLIALSEDATGLWLGVPVAR